MLRSSYLELQVLENLRDEPHASWLISQMSRVTMDLNVIVMLTIYKFMYYLSSK